MKKIHDFLEKILENKWIALIAWQICSLIVCFAGTICSLIVSINNETIPLLMLAMTYFIILLSNVWWWPSSDISWWKYFLVAFFGVIGDWTSVMAYNMTSLASAMLLGTTVVFWVAPLSYFVFKRKINWKQFLSMLLAAGGISLVLVADGTEGSILIGNIVALLSAVLWNLFTWWKGLPSSSSHALIGGLLGATIVKAGFEAVHLNTLLDKVIIPMFTSPVLGFCAGFTLMLILAWIIVITRAHPYSVNKSFRKLQLISSGLMALSHGSNDAQKTMGIITLALLAGGVLHKGPTGEFDIPIYVILACAITMAAGTMISPQFPIQIMIDILFTYFFQTDFGNRLNLYNETLAALYDNQ